MTSSPAELFLNHFDDLLATPEAVEQLNAAILQLAVQGKLVPQDPEDEPASELLNRIRASRNGTGDLQPIGEDEKPFGLPAGWAWARIPEVTDNWGQKRPDKTFTYIDVSSIDNRHGTIGDGLQIIEPADAPSRARKIAKKGSVIYSTVRPYLLNIAVVDRDINPEPIVSTAFYVMHPVEGLDGRFLYLYLRSKPFTQFVESQMTGMAYPAISDGKMSLGIIPLPPLAEQRRIVARVEQLLAQTRQLADRLGRTQHDLDHLTEAALGQLLNAATAEEFNAHWAFIAGHFDLLFREPEHVAPLRQAILELAVRGKLTPRDPRDEPAGELLKRIQKAKNGKAETLSPVSEDEKPFRLPQGWEWARVGEVAYGYRGYNPPKHEFVTQPKPGYVRFVQITDFKTEERAVYVPISSKNKMIYKGEIIMAAYRHIGKLSREMEGAFNVALCKVMELPPMSRDYLEKLIGTTFVKGELLKASGRAHIPSMHLGHLLSLVIPLPPLAEQHRIVARVDQLLKLCDTLEAKLEASREARERVVRALVARIQDGAQKRHSRPLSFVTGRWFRLGPSRPVRK